MKSLICLLLLSILFVRPTEIQSPIPPIVKGDYEVFKEFVQTLPVNIQSRFTKIIQCESGIRQTDSHGRVIVSPTNDVGLGQINIKTWGKEADERGLDLYVREDNLEMTRVVLEKQGLGAWVCNRLI